ncbi:unnamed protein product [Closterium sp. NIES-54]
MSETYPGSGGGRALKQRAGRTPATIPAATTAATINTTTAASMRVHLVLSNPPPLPALLARPPCCPLPRSLPLTPFPSHSHFTLSLPYARRPSARAAGGARATRGIGGAQTKRAREGAGGRRGCWGVRLGGQRYGVARQGERGAR